MSDYDEPPCQGSELWQGWIVILFLDMLIIEHHVEKERGCLRTDGQPCSSNTQVCPRSCFGGQGCPPARKSELLEL